MTITSWKSDDYPEQLDAVLDSLGIPDDDRFSAALELGLIDGDCIQTEDDEVWLLTERTQILRNIEAARKRANRSIAELVTAGEIVRPDLA